jgi:thiamine pyrophosphokinase
VGGAGGRLDHLLANFALLASEAFASLRIVAYTGDARVTVVRDAAELPGKPGSLLTLLALGGPARGVDITGVRYPLDGAQLDPGSTLGVSNELVEPTATVRVGTGVVLAVQPYGGER